MEKNALGPADRILQTELSVILEKLRSDVCVLFQVERISAICLDSSLHHPGVEQSTVAKTTNIVQVLSTPEAELLKFLGAAQQK
jgi:hypothetical protein